MKIKNLTPINFNVGTKIKHSNNKIKLPITINNFHKVDETLMRGAKPTEAQLKELKSNGVNTIISFCTNYNPQNPKLRTIPDESAWAQKLGIKFHWIPERSNRNPSADDVNKFFRITDYARARGEKVFIHCKHGADRTGLFSAIYRLRNQNAKLSDVIKELLKYGHDANNNPNIIPFIIDFKEHQSPINKIIELAQQGLNLIERFINELLAKLK